MDFDVEVISDRTGTDCDPQREDRRKTYSVDINALWRRHSGRFLLVERKQIRSLAGNIEWTGSSR